MTDESSIMLRNSNVDFKFEPSKDGQGAFIDTKALHKTMDSFATTLKLVNKEANESHIDILGEKSNQQQYEIANGSPKKFKQSVLMDERVELSEEDLELLLQSPSTRDIMKG